MHAKLRSHEGCQNLSSTAFDRNTFSMHVIALAGSPSAASRSTALLEASAALLQVAGLTIDRVVLRALPPGALITGDTAQPAIRQALQHLARADLVIVATPIYQAAYCGLLKLFLDLLPAGALRGKVILPLATGGSMAHMLALEYSLKPVLSVLGARHVLDIVYALDDQFNRHDVDGFLPAPELLHRLRAALAPLTAGVETGQTVDAERCSA
jgi:FMN reductase